MTRSPPRLHCWLRCLTATVAMMCVIWVCLIGSSAAVAQQTDQPSDETGDESQTESTPDGTSRHGAPTFDEVEVERVRPGELPPREDTSLPDVLRSNTDGNTGSTALPEPPSAEELNQTAGDVAARVWPVVALQNTDESLRETPSLFRGHAVAIGSEPPILVTSFAWLKNVDEVYLVTPKPRKEADESEDSTDQATTDPTKKQLPHAPYRDLDQITLAGQTGDWLDANRDRLVQVDLFRPDKHRNLVTLVPRDVSAIDLPDAGLSLFDVDRDSPTRLYGHSPYATEASLQMTTLTQGDADKKTLSYYLRTTWRPAHGAPLVTTAGEIVTITAMSHPADPADPTTLVIPPDPLRGYLEEVRNSLNSD